jgi:hypothetical protein
MDHRNVLFREVMVGKLAFGEKRFDAISYFALEFFLSTLHQNMIKINFILPCREFSCEP